MIAGIIIGIIVVIGIGAIALVVIDNDNVLEHDYPDNRKERK